MFLLFGTSVRETIINVVTFVCGYCSVRAPQNVTKRSNRFTLFFIPLFTVSRRHFNICTNCGGTTALTKEQATNGLQWAERNREVR